MALLLENLTVQRNKFLSQSPATRSPSKISSRGDSPPQAGAPRDYTLRVWSAGCSAGQEPYTVAILICDALAYYYLRNPLPFENAFAEAAHSPTMESRNRLPSDISYTSLRTGQEGLYTEQQMEPVDYTCRLRYFRKSR